MKVSFNFDDDIVQTNFYVFASCVSSIDKTYDPKRWPAYNRWGSLDDGLLDKLDGVSRRSKTRKN